jgi:hypothetical protein
MIYRGPGSYDSAPRSPSPPPIPIPSASFLSFSVFLCVGGGGWAWSQIIRPPESLGLYKLFNTLCMRPSLSCAKCAWWPLTTKSHLNYPSGAFIKGTESRDLLSGMLNRWIGLKDWLKSGELEMLDDISSRINCA